MIKSPCRICPKHELNFPNCFDDCEIIFEVQRECQKRPYEPFNSFSFIPGENYSFNKITRKLPALS